MDRGLVGTEGNEDTDETQRPQDSGMTDDSTVGQVCADHGGTLSLKKNVTSANFRH